MEKIMRFFILLTLVFLNFYQAAEVKAGIEKIAEHGAWKVFKGNEGKSPVCFMQSAPVKEEGTFSKREKPVLTVTNRPGKKEFDVVSIKVGYPFKKDFECPATVLLGKGKVVPFKLFTNEDTAWAEDEKMDATFVKAMKSGQTLVVEGLSPKDTTSKDIYSLEGFSKAYEALCDACPRS